MRTVFILIVSALVLIGGSAAVATTFYWTGTTSTAWDVSTNWNPSSGIPNGSSDAAIIDVGAANQPNFNDAADDFDIDSISLNADTNDADVTLTMTSGSLDALSRIMIKGEQGGSPTHRAKLKVDGGTLTPQKLEFIGHTADTASADDLALADFNENVTVGSATDSTSVVGFVDFDVASGKVFAAKALSVGTGTDLADLQIGFDSSPGAGETDCTSLNLAAGNADNENSTVTVRGGVLDVNGAAALRGSSSANAKAKLVVNSGAIFDPDTADLIGGTSAARAAVLDLSESATVNNTSNSTDVTGHALVNVASGKIFTARALAVGNGLGLAYLQIGDTGTGELDASSCLIRVGDGMSEDSTAELHSGTFDINGQLTLQSSSVDALSKLIVAGGTTCTPDALVLAGGTSAARAAVLDLDENVTVGNSTSSTTFTGFGQLDAASGKTFTGKSVGVGDGTSSANVTFGSAGGTGTVTATSITISAGDQASETALLLVDTGGVTLSGGSPTTTIIAAESVDADATLEFDSGGTADFGALTLNGGNAASGGLSFFYYDSGSLTALDSITMTGLSRIDADAFFEVLGDLDVTGSAFATEATVNAVYVQANTLRIGGTQACKLTVSGLLITADVP